MAKETSPAAVTNGSGGAKTLKTSSMHLTESNTVLNGKWTHTASGKASIFATTWLGNPVAATPGTMYAAEDHWDDCSLLNDK